MPDIKPSILIPIGFIALMFLVEPALGIMYLAVGLIMATWVYNF
tara:strand:+ start:373 stop:504 length:132 start_codon:yes stop_codon:yes gene_type:complete